MRTGLNNSWSVLKIAISSRFLLLTLISIWRSIFSPYDSSASLNPTCLNSPNSIDSNQQPHIRWPSIGSAIESSIVWDGVYFARIAECGYEYEQSYAFFPLLPICIFLLSRTVFAPIIPLIGHRAVLGLSGYALNNITFPLAAVYFYKLSNIILKDPEAALRASILFCINPASIFYSSIYSETLYSLFAIGGVYHLLSGANLTAVVWFALSGFARSNGVLNAGYICYQSMHKGYDAIFVQKRAPLAVQVLLAGALQCICVFIPFIAFQAYGYFNICTPHSLVGTSTWCKARIPLLYNYIQSHYWGVGFLRYFQLKQLPNFMLAFPILFLAFCAVIHFTKFQKEVLFSLGFQAFNKVKTAAILLSPNNTNSSEKSLRKFQPENQYLRRRKIISAGQCADVPLAEYESSAEEEGYLSPAVLPFILHLAFMSATAFFVMHVQVATRFLSSSPPLYWFASYLMASPRSSKIWGYLIWAYSVAYILIGTLLFSNFYPFT